LNQRQFFSRWSRRSEALMPDATLPSSSVVPLFRQQAVDEQAAAAYGAPIASIPGSWRVLTAFFVALLVAIATFLATQTFARKESAIGVLSLSLGEIRIVPQKVGTITNIYVRDGQVVKAGQPVARMSTSVELTDGRAVDEELLGAIERQRTALRARLESLDAALPLERRAIADRLAAERAQLVEMRRSAPEREDRLATARESLDAGRVYRQRGIISGNELRQRQYEYLAQHEAMQTFKAQIAQLVGSVAQDQALQAKLPRDQEQSRSSLLSEIAVLDEKRANATSLGGYVVTAKVAGRVTALQAKIGQTVDGTRPLMTLAPTGSRLQAELFVPSRAIGFIRRGQTVRLLYDAFPYQQFGAADGIVDGISTTVLMPDEVGAPVLLREPVYRVVVIPSKTEMFVYGRAMPLRPGMALTADLVLEERSFLRLMLDPLLAARGRIMGR
jgi:membrane fusion protein